MGDAADDVYDAMWRSNWEDEPDEDEYAFMYWLDAEDAFYETHEVCYV